MKAKKEYKELRESGDLYKMFPDFTGEWVEDRTEFEKMWEMNNSALMDIDIIVDDEESL